MTTKWITLALLLLALFAPSIGGSAVLSFSQNGDTKIVSAIILVGPCAEGEIPTGTPTVAVSSNQVSISSTGYFDPRIGYYLCDPADSPPVTVKAPIDALADGTYSVSWTYDQYTISGSFTITNGVLQTIYPTAITGFWYDQTASGSGFNFEMEVFGFLVTYYGWDANGNRLWLTSDFGPSTLIPGNPITLNMSATVGGTFTHPQHTLIPWGTLVVNFSSCRNATATLSGTDGTVNLNLSHLTFIGNVPAC